MEEFYTLLSRYNTDNNLAILPKWTAIYREPMAPVYWSVLENILNKLPKNYSVFEIGSGAGDLLALIYNLGFKNISGSESNNILCSIANEKLYHFFKIRNKISNKIYPYKIDKPNILIQVNCVYFEGISCKDEYLSLLKKYYTNANPDYYIVEVIDDTFVSENSIFPQFVRLSKEDIKNTFIGKSIQYYKTYVYPTNTSSKTIYIIS